MSDETKLILSLTLSLLMIGVAAMFLWSHP